MRNKLTTSSAVLVAGAAVAAIVAAPMAVAAPAPLPKICIEIVTGISCQTHRNGEIDHSGRAVDFYPYGSQPYLSDSHR